MQYTIRHVTRFTYEASISQSVMEARMQPRTDATQRCIRFGLSTTPPSRVKMYQDHDGNIVHHFNIPGRHRASRSRPRRSSMPAPSRCRPNLGVDAWVRLDGATPSGRFWDELNPSPFAHRTPLLDELAKEIGLARGDDPLEHRPAPDVGRAHAVRVQPEEHASRFANRRRAVVAARGVPGLRARR